MHQSVSLGTRKIVSWNKIMIGKEKRAYSDLLKYLVVNLINFPFSAKTIKAKIVTFLLTLYFTLVDHQRGRLGVVRRYGSGKSI